MLLFYQTPNCVETLIQFSSYQLLNKKSWEVKGHGAQHESLGLRRFLDKYACVGYTGNFAGLLNSRLYCRHYKKITRTRTQTTLVTEMFSWAGSEKKNIALKMRTSVGQCLGTQWLVRLCMG